MLSDLACETPCVVTNVGDSAWIVGDLGIITPAQNPEVIKQGLINMIKKIQAEDDLKVVFKQSLRQRIVTQFSVSQLCLKTQTALL